MSVAIARVIATRVLHRVATEGAWASPTLDAEIERARADERDAALATAIVYGTLRVLPSTDRAIAAKVTKKGGALEPVAQAALRAATFQLVHLRTPSHAVVSDAVSIVRSQRGEGLARFTNAVLRKITAERPQQPEPPSELEIPAWLAREIERGLGSPERARSFLRARALPPPIALRVSDRVDRAELADRIRAARPGATVREGALSPLALVVSRAGDPRALPGWHEGLFAVQDEGSQVVALLLDAAPGERIADACAGRGGKTALLLSRVGATGNVTAIDLHEPKLERIPEEIERLGLPSAALELDAIDLSVGDGGLDARFDRVLVDAPCTGLGTVHRRPEILMRIGPGDPARMAALQRSIARNAARMVRPGGLLAIAVCSPTRAEGPELADAIERDVPELVRVRERVAGIAIDPDADGVFRIGPFSAPGDAPEGDQGPDAYQIVRYRRT